MKHIFLRLFSALVAIVILLSCVTPMAFAQGVSSADDDEHHTRVCTNCGVQEPFSEADISTIEEYYEVINTSDSRKADVAMLGYSNLPSAVDNSTSPYFPEIGNQKNLGACGAFGTVYYQFTYTMNKQLKRAYTGTETLFSPKWAYNLINEGVDNGLSPSDCFKMLKEIGCPSEASVPYDTTDFTSWSTDADIWREAMRYKLKDFQRIEEIGLADSKITSVDDPDIELIKTMLYNGDVLNFTASINSWKTTRIKADAKTPENNKYLGEKIVKYSKWDNNPHDMNIVGYNDKIWCDINENNEVDEGEMGAFKIVNSWGKSYGNNGFMWIAYDAVNYRSSVYNAENVDLRYKAISNVYRIEVCDPSQNEIYVKFTVNTADRSQFEADFAAEYNFLPYEGEFLDSVKYTKSTNRYSFDGTKNACDATFVYSLKNIIPDLDNFNFESCEFTITLKDTKADSVSLVVKDISVVNEYTGEQYKAAGDFPITLNSSASTVTIKKKTQSSVTVCYAGFDNPTLHYKTGDSDFTAVKMEENYDHRGHIYRYFIGDATDAVTLYFSDDNGRIDDNFGEYYVATQGLNKYYTKDATQQLEILDIGIPTDDIDVGQSFYFDVDVAGGYAPYIYKLKVVDLTLGMTYNFNEWGSRVQFLFDEESAFEVTIDVMDSAGQTATLTKVFEAKDNPVQLYNLSLSKENGIVKKQIDFIGETRYHQNWDNVVTRFVVKDSNNVVVREGEENESSYFQELASKKSYFTFTPEKAGEYTVTFIIVNEDNGTTTEKTAEFTVYDRIVGDADGNSSVNILDVTRIQMYLAQLITNDEIYFQMADTNSNLVMEIMDATNIQLYLAEHDGGDVGKVIGVKTVTFTNAVGWDEVYCYYRSSTNPELNNRWPGSIMTKKGVNENGEDVYTINVPQEMTSLTFTDKKAETMPVEFNGEDADYYPVDNGTGNFYSVIQIS